MNWWKRLFSGQSNSTQTQSAATTNHPHQTVESLEDKPANICFVCRQQFQTSQKGTTFECAKCGFSGTAHTLCLGMPAVGGMIGFVQNVCPRCKDAYSKPVEGVDEKVIDEIIDCLATMDKVDQLPLSVQDKLSKSEWKGASSRLAEIGNQINDKGGFSLMQKAFKRVHNKSGRRGSYLDRAWNGIGEWMA